MDMTSDILTNISMFAYHCQTFIAGGAGDWEPIFLSNKSGPISVSIKSISSSFEVAQTLLLAITHSVPAPQPPSLPTSHHFSKKNVILSILSLDKGQFNANTRVYHKTLAKLFK